MKKQILILMIATASLQLNAMDVSGDVINSELVQAAHKGNYSRLRSELSGGAGENQKEMNQALIAAITSPNQNPNIVKLLILNGANPDNNDAEALIEAIKLSNRNPEIINALLTTIPFQDQENLFASKLALLTSLKVALKAKNMEQNLAKMITQMYSKEEFRRMVNTQITRVKRMINTARQSLSCPEVKKEIESEQLDINEEYESFKDESQNFDLIKSLPTSMLLLNLITQGNLVSKLELCQQIDQLNSRGNLALIRKQIVHNITYLINQQARSTRTNYYSILNVTPDAYRDDKIRAFNQKLAKLQQTETRNTLYKKLGVKPNATQEEIKAAFEARKLQPMQEPNAYSVLGVNQNASQEEIDNAYDNLAEANLRNSQRAKEIAAAYAQINSKHARENYARNLNAELYDAYDILSDKYSREKYDKSLYPELHAAYETLMNPKLRKQYNYSLKFIEPQQ
jgi:hypothetical protein